MSLNAVTSTFTNAVATTVTIENTSNGAAGGVLQLSNTKDGGNGGVSDIGGTIQFVAKNDGGAVVQIGQVRAEVTDPAAATLSSSLKFFLANEGELCDTNHPGIVIEGNTGTAEVVNTTLSHGAASVTTIAGTLTMGSTAAMTNAGLVSVAAQTNITSVGTLTNLNVDDVNINTKTITILGDTGDTFNITTGAAGATALTTVDAAGSNGHISLIADGQVKLRPTTGIVRIENPDTSVVDGQAYSKLQFSNADGDYDDNAEIRAVATEDHENITPAIGTKLEFRASMKQDAGGNTLMLTLDPDDGATFSVPLNRKFTKTLAGTHFDAQGDILYLGGGSTTQGDLCYLKEDGEWGQADADGAATGDDADRDAMGMLAIALGTDPDVDGMLIRGTITMDYDCGDCGNPIYVSTTASKVTNTAPTASGDFVRVVGYCLDDTNGQIYFNPDNTWVEIA
tara:strand:+ start:1 stop:1359 length:1359 start_codon:yes stop_codon:yes gene_type:complete